METVIIIFAKSPIRAKVKSRLGMEVGIEASLWIYKKLLYHTSKVTLKSKLKTVLFKNKESPILKTDHLPYF